MCINCSLSFRMSNTDMDINEDVLADNGEMIGDLPNLIINAKSFVTGTPKVMVRDRVVEQEYEDTKDLLAMEENASTSGEVKQLQLEKKR